MCNTKTNETKWMDHIVSTNHLELCKYDKDKFAIKFFGMIFNTIFKNEIYNLKSKKTLDFWRSYFATKLPQENFDLLCSDSNNHSELEASLTADLLDFIQNITHDIGETYFKSLDKITFGKICGIEINDHFFMIIIILKNIKMFKIIL